MRSIRDVLDDIAGIADREERARVITQVLQMLPGANEELARMRREDVQAMIAAGDSYRKIGPRIGVHWTRVGDIVTGRPTGNSSRARAAKTRASSDEGSSS